MSKTPADAASKVLSRTCRESKIHGQCTLFITIKETTSGSAKKEYKYKGKRSKLKKVEKVKVNGKEVQFKYKNTIKAVKVLCKKTAKKTAKKTVKK